MTTAATPLPLTTTFTPPSTCLHNEWLVSSSTKTWMNLGPAHTAECLPSGWQISSYYSPGLCPSGYQIAASGIVYDGTVTETAATCCPTCVHTHISNMIHGYQNHNQNWTLAGPGLALPNSRARDYAMLNQTAQTLK
ncbi:uncharacterized protein BO80DRAFT_442435 [Aspergillus ibericus CBS 121593]|uniref:Uncharacterized protein n=1 Tax=Aspergillus ibericus CBS 121593 TaxID=1448316 RepID=A0A395H864_9EURO|nr:hypothetical protein BO80DRAFT_442435 [Aspergillus ibericus CBS 121593]RAL03860.1 hypothetical protein BO80DRAFT_442435 [Aspergillus ibericus CBS 121593]